MQEQGLAGTSRPGGRGYTYTRWEDADPATETFFKGNAPGPTEPGTIKVQSGFQVHVGC